MRILLLSTSTTHHQPGGTEIGAETLAKLASRGGHEVFLVTAAHPSGLTRETADGYTTVYLDGTDYRMSRATSPAWWKISAAKTSELCAAENIDVVWAENFSGLSYAAIPRPARKPVISIVNGLAVRGEIASSFSRVSTAQELVYFFTRYAAQTLFYYIPRFRAMVRDSDLLVAISRETAKALATEFPGSKSKTRVIFNPINTRLFRPDGELRRKTREELGLAESDRVLLMAGVLHKQKGVDIGLKAFTQLAARFPNARLLIAGDGPESGALKALAAKAGLEGRVIFCGLKQNEEMPNYYNAADIYLNPTLRQEGLGLVTVEAMACAVPAVVSRIGGTASSLEDGVSGFFVRPGHTEDIVERAAALLEDPKLAERTGKAAREKAVKDFSEANIESYIRISEELTGGR